MSNKTVHMKLSYNGCYLGPMTGLHFPVTECKNLGVRFRKPKSGNVRFQKVKNLNVNLTDFSASPEKENSTR